ncbi:relaxase/mobilization nuclease domain-containing protein [Spirosoma sp.]|uniref:relaxase/mobilization nuclease domain-containing protein n=1 Tax=Spirosoma sp. TaxID=1899569 RepID=UPI00262D97E1|nr:relaxase/mobilization nuclease domain-containing protein [Spirosoma sp.]MCX6212777.1 relaxase/mobilization nuclease domain-containing protein [Spirosoma sp.]
MIGKTSIGTSFGGCVRYQFEGHKHSQEQKQAEVLEAVGVRMSSASSMTADFNRGRLLNPDLGRAVWHTSVSFNPDDAAKLTNEKMLAVAQDYVTGMGLDQTQYVIIRHHDQPHPHFHLIANRVDNQGQTISDSHNYARSQALLKELSIRHELTPVAERRAHKQRPDQLQGADRSRHQIRQTLEQVLASCTSGQAFAERVQAQGITYQVRQNEGGKAVGVSFAKDGHTFKGSDIARQYSYAGIVKQLEANHRQQQAAQAQKQAAQAIKPVEAVTPVVRAQTSPEGPKKAPELSEVERKWQDDYQQQVQRVRLLNEQIRATNVWIEQAAQTLAQNPTLKTAQALKKTCPDYGLRQVLDGQIKASESYQFQVEWRAEQRQALSRQAESWFGLSSEAREAKAKLSYLNDPNGSGLDYHMREKHYDFWIHARQETKAKPSFGFQASAYQKQEHSLVSLSQFAQQRETAHQQEQAQQLRLKQYQNRGPRLGGRGMS